MKTPTPTPLTIALEVLGGFIFLALSLALYFLAALTHQHYYHIKPEKEMPKFCELAAISSPPIKSSSPPPISSQTILVLDRNQHLLSTS
jgi:hypothetical protein